MTVEPKEIDQGDDFVSFKIDSQLYDVDLFAAHDALRKIDIKHKDDPWECYVCLATFYRASDDLTTACPHCGDSETRRDNSWLDDVAAYVRTLGPERCGRNAAGQFYNEIVERVCGLKKKPN